MRIRAVMRRQPAGRWAPNLTIGDITLNRDKHEALKQGEPVELTPVEFTCWRC